MKIVNLTKPTSEELYNRVLILLYITHQWKLTLTHSLTRTQREERKRRKLGRGEKERDWEIQTIKNKQIRTTI